MSYYYQAASRAIHVDWAAVAPYPAEVRVAVNFLTRYARKRGPNYRNNQKKYDKYLRIVEEHRLCSACKNFKKYHAPTGECLFETTVYTPVSDKLSNDPLWRNA